MICVRILSASLAASLAVGAGRALADPPQGDPVRGKTLYSACMGCHSLDENDVGPKHRGVVGRRAGTVQGFNYSPALKASGLTWSEANLDRWLTSPQAMVPGARMFFSISNAQNRADIIAYLAQQR
jgi:cytochrome c